jgi:hypothetical protein
VMLKFRNGTASTYLTRKSHERDIEIAPIPAGALT